MSNGQKQMEKTGKKVHTTTKTIVPKSIHWVIVPFLYLFAALYDIAELINIIPDVVPIVGEFDDVAVWSILVLYLIGMYAAKPSGGKK